MHDNQMWLVLRKEDKHIMMPLSDILSIECQDECLTIMARDTDEWDDHIMDVSEDQGIAKTGSFVNCFDYIKNKESKK